MAGLAFFRSLMLGTPGAYQPIGILIEYGKSITLIRIFQIAMLGYLRATIRGLASIHLAMRDPEAQFPSLSIKDGFPTVIGNETLEFWAKFVGAPVGILIETLKLCFGAWLASRFSYRWICLLGKILATQGLVWIIAEVVFAILTLSKCRFCEDGELAILFQKDQTTKSFIEFKIGGFLIAEAILGIYLARRIALR